MSPPSVQWKNNETLHDVKRTHKQKQTKNPQNTVHPQRIYVHIGMIKFRTYSVAFNINFFSVICNIFRQMLLLVIIWMLLPITPLLHLLNSRGYSVPFFICASVCVKGNQTAHKSTAWSMGIYCGTCSVIHPNIITTVQNRTTEVQGNWAYMSLCTNFQRLFVVENSSFKRLIFESSTKHT